MIPLIIIISLYLLGIALRWTYVRISYSENGIYSHSKPGSDEIFLTLCPGINLFWGLMDWANESPYCKTTKSRTFSERFFGLKKDR